MILIGLTANGDRRYYGINHAAAAAPSAAVPDVSIVSPPNNATYEAPATFTLLAESSTDLDYVEFVYCADGTNQPTVLGGRLRNAPYAAQATNFGAGTYTFIARAVDTGGVSADSSPITITISGQRAPSIKLLTPTTNRIFEEPASIEFTAEANARDYGTVTRVEYYNGNTTNEVNKVCESADASTNYRCIWNGPQSASPGQGRSAHVKANKEYLLAAKVITNEGASVATTPASVTVTPPASATRIKDATATYAYPPFVAGGVGSYYVDGDGTIDNIVGNDATGNGSEAEPWLTLAKAIAVAPSGSTIVMRAGTYRGTNNSGDIVKKLIIQPYPHEVVWFKGSDIVTDWQFDAALNLWYQDNWTYDFRPPPNQRDSDHVDYARNPLASLRDMVFIDGRPLTQIARYEACSYVPVDCTGDVVQPGTFCHDYAANKLYIKDDPRGRTVEATTQTNTLTIRRNPAASDSVVRGLGFAHYSEAAIDFGISSNPGAQRVRIEDNTFVWNAIEGVRLQGPNTVTGNTNVNPNADRPYMIVRGNTFSYNGRGGLSGSRAHNLLLENNLINYNNLERFRTAWSANGVKLFLADDMVVRNNVVEDNLSHGIWFDTSDTDVTVVNNIVQRNLASGIFFEVSSRAIIASNLLVGNSIQVSNSSLALIYNNTVVDGGIVIRDSNRINDRPPNERAVEVAAGIDWESRGLVLKNNIISNRRAGENVVIEVSHQPCGTVGSPCNDTESVFTAIDYNAYFRTDAQQPANLFLWKPIGIAAASTFTSLSSFNSAIGFEPHGIERNGELNSFFINEAAGDYRLNPSSPARGTGEPLPDNIASAIGVTANTPVDRGVLAVSNAVFMPNISAVSSGMSYSRVTRTFNSTITLTNTGQQMITGSLQVLLDDLTDAVALANKTGDFNADPYITVDVTGLAPGASLQVPVRFINLNNVRIGYATKVYAGSF